MSVQSPVEERAARPEIGSVPRAEFIESNLGLAHSCAARFTGRGIEYDDLYAAACLGLVKACDGFDQERGLCFSTYAVPVILGEVKKLFRDGGTVKVGRTLKELGIKIGYEREKCLKQTGAEPSVGELAKRLSASPEQVAMAIRAAMPVVSLSPENDDEGDSVHDIPVASHEEQLADKIGLQEVLRQLMPRDMLLIKLRFYMGKTQSETAKTLHTTQVQISRRERRILCWMRSELNGG